MLLLVFLLLSFLADAGVLFLLVFLRSVCPALSMLGMEIHIIF
jgi:hypothetical protein